MRPFTPRDAGNPPGRWRAQPFWRNAPLIGLPPRETRIVVLAAHADDETLGVGGVIAAAGRCGHAVQIVIASDGSGSHPRSPTLSPARLADVRRTEAARAAAALAPGARVVQLGLPDGELAGAVDDIADALRSLLGADTDTWLLSTWLGDGHPDHAACSRAARRVAAERRQSREFEYPVWYWHAGDPDRPGEVAAAARMFELDPRDRAARARALRCYPSQTEPLSAAPGDEAVLPPHVLAHADRSVDVLLDVVARPAGEPDYFRELYATSDDPWRLRDSRYERRKRDRVLRALPLPRYRRCFEPGSARGDLSLRLIDRVHELVCAETDATAAAEARRRLGTRAQVLPLRVPGEWPDGEFDLIVLSEIGYYLDLTALTERIEASLTADGTLLLVHWRHVAQDHPHTAETVHLTLSAQLGLNGVVAESNADFLLDVLVRDQADAPPSSVR